MKLGDSTPEYQCGPSTGREQLDQLLQESQGPQALMAFWRTRYPALYEADAGIREGYTVGQHTEMALGQFEKYFADEPLPAQADSNFFRNVIALHDVGVHRALAMGSKRLQHAYTRGIAKDILTELGY